MKRFEFKSCVFLLTALTISTLSVSNIKADELVETGNQVNNVQVTENTNVTEATPDNATVTVATTTTTEGQPVENAATPETAIQTANNLVETTDTATETTAAQETPDENSEAEAEAIETEEKFTYEELETAGQLHVDDATPTEGRWVSGEIHTHTNVSADASEPYMVFENVTNAAFREEIEDLPEEGQPSLEQGDSFDYLMTADHLRNSPRDVNGNENPTAHWEKMWQQVNKFNELKAEGKYEGKIYYPGFEWDMFGLDHGSVAIVEDSTNRVPIDALHEFEWLFSYDTSDDMFYSNEEEVYGPRQNEKADKENTFRGLQWLQDKYPDSIVIANHPSRHAQDDSGVVRVEDLRRMQDTAPDVFIGFEGMPGNQMGGDRGEIFDVYGGTDVMVAQVGGVWDSLLGEGRHFYNLSNSDFHFKVSSNRRYSSGYWPSEYSRNYSWVEGNTFEDMVEGLKSGNSFSTFGDLITALDFRVIQNGREGVMGSDFNLIENEAATLVIRFKESDLNNYRSLSGENYGVTNDPKVDHIDLIAGSIYGPVADPTMDSNPTTKVVARFDASDWGLADEDGFYTVTYDFVADNNQYFRLRGTNLSLNVPGETDENGNPLLDVELDVNPDDFESEDAYLLALEEYFNDINNRNYSDLWFYSNPIFTYTISENEVIVDEGKTPVDSETPIKSGDENTNSDTSIDSDLNTNENLSEKTVQTNDNNQSFGQKEVINEVISVDSDIQYTETTQNDISTSTKQDDAKNLRVDKMTILPNTGFSGGFSGAIGLIISALGLTLFKKRK